MKNNKTRLRLIIYGILFLLFLIFIMAIRSAGNFLVRDDKPFHADVAVILMGSIADRVLQAADLYKTGNFDRLIVVEERIDAYNILKDRGVNLIRNAKQCKDAAIALGIPDSCIVILPGDAASTQQEAIIIAKYLELHNETDTLIVVSSSAHTRRAAMIFKKVFHHRPGITVLTSASSYSGFEASHWWRHKESIQDVVFEYIKIFNFLLIDQFRIPE